MSTTSATLPFLMLLALPAFAQDSLRLSEGCQEEFNNRKHTLEEKLKPSMERANNSISEINSLIADYEARRPSMAANYEYFGLTEEQVKQKLNSKMEILDKEWALETLTLKRRNEIKSQQLQIKNILESRDIVKAVTGSIEMPKHLSLPLVLGALTEKFGSVEDFKFSENGNNYKMGSKEYGYNGFTYFKTDEASVKVYGLGSYYDKKNTSITVKGADNFKLTLSLDEKQNAITEVWFSDDEQDLITYLGDNLVPGGKLSKNLKEISFSHITYNTISKKLRLNLKTVEWNNSWGANSYENLDDVAMLLMTEACQIENDKLKDDIAKQKEAEIAQKNKKPSPEIIQVEESDKKPSRRDRRKKPASSQQ